MTVIKMTAVERVTYELGFTDAKLVAYSLLARVLMESMTADPIHILNMFTTLFANTKPLRTTAPQEEKSRPQEKQGG